MHRTVNCYSNKNCSDTNGYIVKYIGEKLIMLGHMIKRAICNKWMVLACTVSIAIIYYEILLGWIPIRGMIKEPEYYNGLAQMVWLFSLCSYYTFAGMFPGLHMEVHY